MYDNNNNNNSSYVANWKLIEISIILIFAYLSSFIIAGFKTKKWKKSLFFIALLFLPVIVFVIGGLTGMF